MKIAYVTYEYPPDTAVGGIATYVKQAALTMIHLGHHVEVFTSSGTRAGFFFEDGITIHRVLENNRTEFAISIAQIFYLRHSVIQFDVFEAPEFNADGRKISELLQHIPYVVRMHTPNSIVLPLISYSGWLNEFKNRFLEVIIFGINVFTKEYLFDPLFQRSLHSLKKKFNSLEKKEAHKSSLVVSPSLDLCSFVIKDWKIKKDKVYYSPHPFIPNPLLLEIPVINTYDHNLVIGYLGRLEKRKGINEIVSIIPQILKMYPNVIFRFVGKPQIEPKSGLSYDKWITKKLKKYLNNIELIGHIEYENIPDVLNNFDIVLLPSTWENFPNSCLESMSAGKPIIASKFGGMSEMLENNVSGLLVNPKIPAELISALSLLISNNEMRMKFGIHARKRVLENYNVEKIGRQIEKGFEMAILNKMK